LWVYSAAHIGGKALSSTKTSKACGSENFLEDYFLGKVLGGISRIFCVLITSFQLQSILIKNSYPYSKKNPLTSRGSGFLVIPAIAISLWLESA
jgi:hypothetical protein